MNRRYDIFISYRRRDVGDKAEHLKDLLEPFYKGRISFDRENLSGRFNTQLIRRLDTVKDFLLVLGKKSLCYTTDDFSPERVDLYKELASLPQEDFEKRIVEVEKQGPIDYVRIEIGRALRRKDLHIIPILPESTSDYCFASLNLPDDIAGIKRYEAVFYSESPDALFKDVVPKIRKHLKSRHTIAVNRKAIIIILSILLIAVACGIYTFKRHISAQKEESIKHKTAMNLEEQHQSLGLRFSDTDNLSQDELSAIADILDKMQEIKPDTLKMGIFEVNVSQWARIMNEPYNHEDSLMPKTNVSLADCRVFIDRLHTLTNVNFDLPTEEEWGYAAHEGNDGKRFLYSGSNNVDSVAWYKGNSGGNKHKCDGGRHPNAFGLYDMSGNVSEICDSPFDAGATDEKGLALYVLRGGNYSSASEEVTVNSRKPFNENEKGNEKVGFRLVIRKIE